MATARMEAAPEIASVDAPDLDGVGAAPELGAVLFTEDGAGTLVSGVDRVGEMLVSGVETVGGVVAGGVVGNARVLLLMLLVTPLLVLPEDVGVVVEPVLEVTGPGPPEMDLAYISWGLSGSAMRLSN